MKTIFGHSQTRFKGDRQQSITGGRGFRIATERTHQPQQKNEPHLT